MGGKSLLYDLTSKIPCFVFDSRLPKETRGKQLEHLVSSLDITRTILDYARVELIEFMEGASLRPLVMDEPTKWREELFLESLYTGRDNPSQEGMLQGKWKYIRMYDGVGKCAEGDVDFADKAPEFEMLFDLNADPKEMRNLIDPMAASQILADLRAKTVANSVTMNQRR